MVFEISHYSSKEAKKEPDLETPITQPPLNLEQILLKQTERFDNILQQMSTLMMLMTKLVDKLSK